MTYAFGGFRLRRQRPDDAAKHFRAAAELFRRSGSRWEEAASIESLASVYLTMADLSQARSAFESALETWGHVGDLVGQARCVAQLAKIAEATGHGEQARYLARQASALLSREPTAQVVEIRRMAEEVLASTEGEGGPKRT